MYIMIPKICIKNLKYKTYSTVRIITVFPQRNQKFQYICYDTKKSAL